MFLLNVLLDLTDDLMYFADHLNSLLLIFCSFSFILTLLFHFVLNINVSKNAIDSKICCF